MTVWRPRLVWPLLWACLMTVSVPLALRAASPEASMLAVDGEVPVKARLVTDVTSLPREGNARVALALEMGPGWHIYATGNVTVGAPTRLTLTSGDAHVGEWAVPPPQHFAQFDGADAVGYAGLMVATSDILASDSVGDHIDLTAEVRLLACKVLCVPGRLQVQARVPVGKEKIPASARAVTRLFAADGLTELDGSVHAEALTLAETNEATSVWLMLAFALLGGLILNVMPCVLPVLVMKAAGLVAAGAEPRTRRRHALGYGLGTVGSMLMLGGVVIVLRIVGLSAGWGFQMQQPAFLAGVTVALTLFCLHAFGVFTLAAPVSGMSERHEKSTGFGKSVLEGVLAVLVATPCSAPLLGSATAFALSQTAPVTLVLFAAIGAGLALPFVLLALWPSQRGLLPKPGAWMNAVKHVLAFALFGTVLWLVWLYAAVAGAGALFSLLLLLWLTSLGAALLGVIESLWPAHGGKRFLLLVVLLALAADGLQILRAAPRPARTGARASADGEMVWAPWSEAAVLLAMREGRPVLVEFTADWCVTCQYNERVLARAAIRQAAQEHQVVLLRADWTRPDDAILNELQKRGRVGVPMTLVFSPKRPDVPQRLPEVLTERALLDAFARL